MAEGGYERQDFWSTEGWIWRTGTYDSRAPDYLKGWLAERPPDKRNQPFFLHDQLWNNPLTPVVGVSWFEAEAYCNWLADELGKPIRLPAEEEWERATRGLDGRVYPWGYNFDEARLNCADFWKSEKDRVNRSTTIVGQFPEGNSPDGLSDTSGNVWEWTLSGDERVRVIRGGSWNDSRDSVRCAARGRSAPDNFNSSIGFRVVSPGS